MYKKIVNLINDYLIYPLCEIISGISRKISKALFKERVLSSKYQRIEQDSKIVKIFIKFQEFIKAILKSISKWTLVPLYNRILSPILNTIGDVFLGMLGGFSHNGKKAEKPEEKKLN